VGSVGDLTGRVGSDRRADGNQTSVDRDPARIDHCLAPDIGCDDAFAIVRARVAETEGHPVASVRLHRARAHWRHTPRSKGEIVTTVSELERAGWNALCSGRARAFYDQVMTADAVFVVPGAVLDRTQTLRSWDDVPRWQSVDLDPERIISVSDDVAIVTYRARAERPDEAPYIAQFTSVYRRRDDGDWRVAFHQQTPAPIAPES
jgi:ketosteroid isomerase-like protein